MSFQVTKVVWFGNDYGIEYIIRDSYCIAFNIVKTPDPTLIDDSKINIGSSACYRGGEPLPGEEILDEDMETMLDFALRARLEGIKFAEEMIIQHKQTLNLSKIFDDVLAANK